MDAMPYGLLAALIGLAGGTVLGLAGRLGNFCTVSAVEMAVYGKDARKLRLWGMVLAVAVLATQFGALAGYIHLEMTFYHELVWNPVASVVGGLMFGYGMAMSGNCGFGALTRMGGGDIRALVIVVVIAIAAYVTLSGPLAPLRMALFPQEDASGPQGILHDLQTYAGLPPALVISVIACGLGFWGLSYGPLRREPHMLFWGVAAGLAVAGCLAGTSWLADSSLGAIDVEGPSFTAPVGRALLFLMTSTAGGISFSVGIVVGVILGGFIGALVRGLFRWEACEDPRELGRAIVGAILMGVGGVVAMGCSVGQGVTAFATLSWSGPVTLAAIAAGCVLGLRHLIGGYQVE